MRLRYISVWRRLTLIPALLLLGGCADDDSNGVGPLSKPCRATTPGEQTIVQEYDSDGKLLAQKHLDHEGELSFSYVFTYDNNGRLQKRTAVPDSITDITPVTTYVYDKDGLLVERQHDDWSIVRFSYDSDGKVTRKDYEKVSDGTATYSFLYKYDEKGRIISREAIGKTHDVCELVTYTYGANGCIADSQCDEYTVSFVYDDARRVVSDQDGDGDYKTTYSYQCHPQDASSQFEQYECFSFPDPTLTQLPREFGWWLDS